LGIRRGPPGETARRDAGECVADGSPRHCPRRRAARAPGRRRGGVPARLARGHGPREGRRGGPVDAHRVAAPRRVSRRVRRRGCAARPGCGVRYGGTPGADGRASIARAAALADRRIALVDLWLEHPTLHETVGLAPTEGIVDAFEYDVSLTKAAHQVDRVFFIAAGTVTAHAGDLFANPRWKKLHGGF